MAALRRLGRVLRHTAPGRSSHARRISTRATRGDLGVTEKTSDEELRSMARKIFSAAVNAVRPYQAVRDTCRVDGSTMTVSRVCADGKLDGKRTFDLSAYSRVSLLAFGKASVGMATAVQDILGDRLSEGVVVTKYGHLEKHRLDSKRLQIVEAAHPTPDSNSVRGAGLVLDAARRADKETLTIVCVSGGSSSLLCAPIDGVSLDELTATTDALLASGCDIGDKNCVLKHLSRVKGGQLRRAIAPGTCITLVISDVVGDELDVIGSGPTVPDPTSFDMARSVAKRFSLGNAIPASCSAAIEKGKAETPGPGDPLFNGDAVSLVATNRTAILQAGSMAESLGFQTVLLGSHIEGEAAQVAKTLCGIATSARAHGIPAAGPVAIICGGETTVTLPPNPGVGGRNQALALAAMKHISGLPGVALLSGGTDGGDGPKNDAAGAVVTGGDYRAALDAGLDYEGAFTRANSYLFFKAFERAKFQTENRAHLRDGITGTNVSDVMVILVR